MKTTIHVYSEQSTGWSKETSTIQEAMRIARHILFESLVKFVISTTEKRDCPLCVDVTTTIGNKTYQYIQVLDGSTLFVASLKSV